MVFSVGFTTAQIDSLNVDEKYLEDQLFFSITFNSLKNTPPDFASTGVSYGISLGFIKDIPLNKMRNKSIGIGLGYGFDSFYQNLRIGTKNDNLDFQVVDPLENNQLVLHNLILPIEYRWRTSTPEKYKFWRVYSGVKLSYLYSLVSQNAIDAGSVNLTDFTTVNKLNYTATLAAGYGTWNFYVNYALNPIFNTNNLEPSSLTPNLNSLRLGLIFYIL